MTLLGLCMAASGCMGDGGERPEDWTLDGDVRGAAFDSEVSDVLDTDGGRDATDVQDTFDTRDTADVAPLDCTCVVEGATCERVERRAVCVHEGANCSDGSCPRGFICRDGRCDCDFDVHGPECRPECTDHDDCGEKQYCNVNDRCYPRRECDFNHARCPPGYWCDYEYNPAPTCRRNGGNPIGAFCKNDWQCESGFCKEETCIRSCFAEEDCPSGDRACGRFNTGYQILGCYTPRDGFSDCNVSCPKDKLCDRDECLPHTCHRTAQCPKGDCILSPDGLTEDGLGQCTGEERLCNGWEFRIEEDDPFCRLAIDCETLNETFRFSCPEGYECVKGDVNPTGGHDIGTSWCSRRVTDGEWRSGG